MKEQYRYIVVEDEDLIRSNIIKKFESFQLPLIFAGDADNGRNALNLIDQVQPDIVFTDIKMPVMNGLELAEELQFSYPDIKIVIITSYDDFSFAQKAMRFGVSDYMLKPVTYDDAQELLQRVIEKAKLSQKEDDVFLPRRNTDEKYSKEDAVRLVEEYLRKNFRQEITMGDVADKIGLTPDYLSRLFKKYKNTSPVKYLSGLRVEEAKRLLLEEPEAEVSVIGEKVGYYDRYYFSRVFKTYVGIYPTEFRKKFH